MTSQNQIFCHKMQLFQAVLKDVFYDRDLIVYYRIPFREGSLQFRYGHGLRPLSSWLIACKINSQKQKEKITENGGFYERKI